MTTLAKQRAIVEVPVKQFFCSKAGNFLNYNEVKHILESVYTKALVKYQYQHPGPFLAELRQKKTIFGLCNGGTLIS